jgi:hypothetical protein
VRNGVPKKKSKAGAIAGIVIGASTRTDPLEHLASRRGSRGARRRISTLLLRHGSPAPPATTSSTGGAAPSFYIYGVKAIVFVSDVSFYL